MTYPESSGSSNSVHEVPTHRPRGLHRREPQLYMITYIHTNTKYTSAHFCSHHPHASLDPGGATIQLGFLIVSFLMWSSGQKMFDCLRLDHHPRRDHSQDKVADTYNDKICVKTHIL
jgi:hypothetical protein